MHNLYKPFRNYLRQFPIVQSLDLIWAYSEHVANGRALPPRMQFRDRLGQPSTERFLIYPWELDVLAREIVLNGDIIGKRSLDTWLELSTVVNKLRRLEDDIAKRYGSPETVLRDLHRVVHQQFPWQRPPSTRTMMRAYKLFGTDAMRPILEATTGIELDAFFKLGMATAGHFLNQAGLNTQQDYSVLGVSKDTSAKFFDRLTIDLPELRERTRVVQRYDDSWHLAVNPLRDHPLIRFDRSHPERVLCPIPTFLMRRFSEGLFYDVVGQPAFAGAIGKAFEAYVGEVLGEVLGEAFAVRGEEEYRVGKDRKDGVDWIVSDATGHVFIECKTKRLRQDAKFIADGIGLEAALDTMAGFIVQHYRNITDALAGRTAWVPDGKQIYPMIVTLEDWWIFSPPIVAALETSLHARMEKAELPLRLLEDMPYVIASADEFETAFQIMSKTGIDAYLGLKRTKENRQWALSAFSPGLFQKELHATHRRLFDEEWRNIVLPEQYRGTR